MLRVSQITHLTLLSQIQRLTRVRATKKIRTEEAVLEMTVATVFCSAGRVGMGLSVGVVGGGPVGGEGGVKGDLGTPVSIKIGIAKKLDE